MVSNPKYVQYNEVNQNALERFDDVIKFLNLNGEHRGHEYLAFNPQRSDNALGSFSINRHSGRWSDFAVNDDKAKGRDLISLTAYIKGWQYRKAAQELSRYLVNQVSNKSASASVKKPKSPEGNQVMPIPANAPAYNFGSHDKPSKIWKYLDEQGNLLGYVFRYETKPRKTYIPVTLWQKPNGDLHWLKKGFPNPKPLYNLHLLNQFPKSPVLIVEGEKAADAASILFPDWVVVTTLQGAKSPEKSDISKIIGREIYIWPDNDDVGISYAETLISMIRGINSQNPVYVIENFSYHVSVNQDASPAITFGANHVSGWDAADALEEGWTPEHIKLLPPTVWKKVPTLREPFSAGQFYVNDDGVFRKKKNENGQEYAELVASPIWPVALTRNEQDRNWGLLLEVINPLGKSTEWAMPQEMLSGSGEACRTSMLNLGAKIYNNASLHQFLMSAKPSQLALCTEYTGWHNDLFILPTQVFGKSSERVVVQNSKLTGQSGFGKKGSLEDWQNHVASKCIGNSRLVFALCVSLSSPFLKLLDEENGGFHLRGSSSSGKTKTLSLAASVWGGKSMVRAWRATSNAIESLAVEHNDCVLILDELGQVSPDAAGDIAYTLGNGQQKARSNRHGDVRSIGKWRLLFISTGEISLAEHVAVQGQRIKAGQEIRMLDVPSDAGAGLGVFENIHGYPSPQVFADEIQASAESFYGTAAEALLTKLTISPEKATAINSVKRSRSEFIRRLVPANSNGQIFRAASRFGMVAAVGEYCIEIGLLPWERGHAESSVEKCYQDWLLARGGNSASEEIRALNQVKAFFEQHGESRFTLIADIPDGAGRAHVENDLRQRTTNRAGFRIFNNNGEMEYWVLPEAYKNQICAGFDARLVTKTLIERQLLQVDASGKPQISKRLPGSSQTTRVYVFKPSIFQDFSEQD